LAILQWRWLFWERLAIAQCDRVRRAIPNLLGY